MNIEMDVICGDYLYQGDAPGKFQNCRSIVKYANKINIKYGHHYVGHRLFPCDLKFIGNKKVLCKIIFSHECSK